MIRWSDPNELARKVHAVAGWFFALVWLVLFLISGRLVGQVLPLRYIVGGGLAMSLLGIWGLHPGKSYFVISSPERFIALSRTGGITFLRRCVVNGDKMNGWLRTRFPNHRVLRADAIEEYILRTQEMERIHLACLLASFVVFALALVASCWLLAGSLLLLTLSTNAGPIILQRFNRARCQRALRRQAAARVRRHEARCRLPT